MARSHHRKKHKTHLRQYQQTHEGGMERSRRTKATGPLVVIGLILGLALGYFGSGTTLWIAGAAIAGAIIGYLIGQYLDKNMGR